MNKNETTNKINTDSSLCIFNILPKLYLDDNFWIVNTEIHFSQNFFYFNKSLKSIV